MAGKLDGMTQCSDFEGHEVVDSRDLRAWLRKRIRYLSKGNVMNQDERSLYNFVKKFIDDLKKRTPTALIRSDRRIRP